MRDFLTLVEEAWNEPFSGWDFAWLRGPMSETPPSWSYPELAAAGLRQSRAVLDMDTGGGEFFASLAPFPTSAWASETYLPNVPIAKARLEPLGVRVEQAYDNQHLPFPDRQFDLILNRHGSYGPQELRRILQPGGRLLTQQVGGRNQLGLNELLQDQPIHPYAFWNADYAVRQLREADFEILRVQEEYPPLHFYDIGAVVYYLKAIPWQVAGFEPSQCMARLEAIDALIRGEGKLTTTDHRFLIEARSP